MGCILQTKLTQIQNIGSMEQFNLGFGKERT